MGRARRASASDAPSIWPRPAIWVWLVANVLWLQLVVPVWIVAALAAVGDPEATVLRRVTAAGTMIVVIPVVGVLGAAGVTLLAALALEKATDRIRRG